MFSPIERKLETRYNTELLVTQFGDYYSCVVFVAAKGVGNWNAYAHTFPQPFSVENQDNFVAIAAADGEKLSENVARAIFGNHLDDWGFCRG